MNANDDNLPDGDDARFDLLVDGELSESERRALLAQLDDVPGGWRRCALAFLEAQCWKQELRSLAREQSVPLPQGPHPAGPTASESLVKPCIAPAAPRSRWHGRIGTLLAMAASFLVALFLGSLLREAWSPGGPARPGLDRVAGVTGPQREQPRLPGLPEQRWPHMGEPAPTQMVTLTVPEGPGGRSQSIQLPVVERNQLDENWLRSFPSAIPSDMLDALRRSGFEVRQQRDLLPLQMRDGRRLVVPVDQVEVHYVGNRSYQ